MSEGTIIVNLEKAIGVLLWVEDENYESTCNGYYGIHIESGLFDAIGTDKLEYGIKFFQSGNFYPPEAPHICEFDIHDFFDLECISQDTDFDFMDSRNNAEEYGLTTEKEIQDAIDDHVKMTREVCASCKRSEIGCCGRYFDAGANEEKLYDHRYTVEWR